MALYLGEQDLGVDVHEMCEAEGMKISARRILDAILRAVGSHRGVRAEVRQSQICVGLK